MPKAKNLLDFYPVVKTPKEFSTPRSSKTRLEKTVLPPSTPVSGQSDVQQLWTPSPSATSTPYSRGSSRPIRTNRQRFDGLRLNSFVDDDHQSGQILTSEKVSAGTINSTQSTPISSDCSSRKRKLSSEIQGDEALCASAVKRPTPSPAKFKQLRQTAREERAAQALDLLKTPESSMQGTLAKMTSSSSSSTIRRSLMSQLTKSVKIDKLKAKLIQSPSDSKVSPASPELTVDKLCLSESLSPIKLTANEQFSSLDTLSGDSPSHLSLPNRYKFLADVFHSTDTVAAIVHNRQEVCTFAKLKPAVQEMMRRNFHLKHLGQIRTVYPSAYTFKQEKILTRGSSKLHPVFEPQLTVAFNMDCFGDQSRPIMHNTNVAEENLSKSSVNVAKEVIKKEAHLPNVAVVKPCFLISRRRVFRKNLIQILFKHHSKFLSTLNFPIKLSSNEVRRWHPSFQLESVPDVEPSDLPEVESSAQRLMSAKDVFAKVRGIYSQQLDKALENVAAKTSMMSIKSAPLSPVSTKTTVVSASPMPESKSNARLKGIPENLLAKIRAKEAEKIIAEMTRDPVTDKRKLMISRLPELVRILRNFFIAEKKAAIVVGFAIKKIGESFIGSLTPVELEEHLKLIAELVPDWLNFVSIRGGDFLKLDRHADINAVLDKISKVDKSIL